MAMPAAAGLFHRAIVQSGAFIRMGDPEPAARLADAVLDHLGLTADTVDKIHAVPTADLLRAAAAARRATTRPAAPLPDWGPVADGTVLPRQAIDPDAPALSAHVPLLVGSTLNEFTIPLWTPYPATMTDAQLLARVHAAHGDRAPAIVAAARAIHPAATPYQLWSIINTAGVVRAADLAMAARKATQGAAPAYCYQFTWQTPVLDGRPMAMHCSDLAFVFDNTARCENMTGNGTEARRLAARMSDAWVAFARTGDPNHPGLPRWDPFTPATTATMSFGSRCVLERNADADLQRLLA